MRGAVPGTPAALALEPSPARGLGRRTQPGGCDQLLSKGRAPSSAGSDRGRVSVTAGIAGDPAGRQGSTPPHGVVPSHRRRRFPGSRPLAGGQELLGPQTPACRPPAQGAGSSVIALHSPELRKPTPGPPGTGLRITRPTQTPPDVTTHTAAACDPLGHGLSGPREQPPKGGHPPFSPHPLPTTRTEAPSTGPRTPCGQ